MLVHLLKFPPEKEGLEYEHLKIKGSPWGRRNGRWKRSRAEGRGRKRMEKLGWGARGSVWGWGSGQGSFPTREGLWRLLQQQEGKWLHSQGWKRWKIRHTALGKRGKQCWGAVQASPTPSHPQGKLWGSLSHLVPGCAAPRCHKPRTSLARNLPCLLWDFRSSSLAGVFILVELHYSQMWASKSRLIYRRIKSFSSFYHCVKVINVLSCQYSFLRRIHAGNRIQLLKTWHEFSWLFSLSEKKKEKWVVDLLKKPKTCF